MNTLGYKGGVIWKCFLEDRLYEAHLPSESLVRDYVSKGKGQTLSDRTHGDRKG